MANERRHDITISGITISLSSKKDTYFDLDAEATRSWKTGILKRNRIRKNCLKIECSMENRDADYVDLVLGLLDPQEFQVEVYEKELQRQCIVVTAQQKIMKLLVVQKQHCLLI